MLQQVLAHVGQLPVGSFLLRRDAGDATVRVASVGATASAADDDARARRMAAGATDSQEVAFIPMRWQPALVNVPQIPFTHPPRGQPIAASRRNVRQQQLAECRSAPAAPPTGSVAAPSSRVPGIAYCHAFSEGRQCSRVAQGQQCPYPHLTMAEVARKVAAKKKGTTLAEEMKAYLQAKRRRPA